MSIRRTIIAAALSAAPACAENYLSFPESAGTERQAFAIFEVAKSPAGLACRLVKSSGDVDADKQVCNFLSMDWKRKIGVQQWPVWVLPPRPQGYVAAVSGRNNLLKVDDYPTAAIQNHESGIVMTRMVVTETGKLESCKTIGSSDSKRLDVVPCRVALKRFEFQPATINGQPVRDIQLRATGFGVSQY